MTYRFECTLCGDCCSGHQEVWLNPGDLERMAQHQGLAVSELYKKGLVEDKPYQGVLRPRIRFKTRPSRFCPFLINDLQESGQLLGLCSLHPHHKPLVCRLAPLGRIYYPREGRREWVLVPPVEGCPGMGQGPEKDAQAVIDEVEPLLAQEEAWFDTLEP